MHAYATDEKSPTALAVEVPLKSRKPKNWAWRFARFSLEVRWVVPDFVKDLLGPMPWTRIMPTGGVDATEESVTRWTKAGVACVGMGSKLFPKDVIAAGEYSKITEKVKAVLEWVKAARGDKAPIA